MEYAVLGAFCAGLLLCIVLKISIIYALPSLPKDEYLNKRKKCAIARKRLAFFVGMWYNICVGTYAYVRG